jgi:hypothetical protein
MTCARQPSWRDRVMPTLRPPQILLIATAMLLLVGLSYREVPGYSYTEIDTPTILRVNRIDEPLDFVRLFGREFRDEVHAGVRFYRPLTAMSHAVEQALFGIEPAGMHRFDIALHGASAILLFLLAYTLGLRLGGAAAAALVFALHPLGVEVVPALARRGDLLAVTLLLLSAVARLRGRQALALVAGAMAPLAKETAFLLPLVWAAQRPAAWREGLREGLRGLAVVAPALILRTLVLHGGGGYQRVAINTDGALSSLLTLFDPFRLFGPWVSRVLFLLLLAALVALWRRRRGVVVRLGTLWLMASLLMATLGGHISSWYLYACLPATALLLAALLREAWEARQQGLGPWAATGAAIPSLALVVCIFVPSPLWTRYPEWAEASRLLELWDRELLRHVRSGEMPEGEPVVLFGVPMQIGQGRSARFFTRAASVALGYTLQDDLRLRHDIDLPVWCAIQVHVHGIAARYEIEADQRDGEIWVRATGPVDLDGADRLAIWRQSEVAPYELRRAPEEGAIVLSNVVPPIWRWNGEELVRWPVSE